MIVLATSLQKLQTVKDFIRAISRKHRFTKPVDSQHVKGSQADFLASIKIELSSTP